MSLLDRAALASIPVVAGNHRKGLEDCIRPERYDALNDDAYAMGASFLRARERAAAARKAAATDVPDTFPPLP